ncbi:MAG TPA: DUF2911 domain-containing protein [Thermoanaerobaculia bacterium]|nr:DUF2911 domain-containing protein [Thermoanaerobaculia bacterium]
MRPVLAFVVLLLLLSLPLNAQELPVPRESPRASISQVIGITTVEIEYHRPAVKGRTIWGELVPYDKVWRLGANDATTIEFSDPVKVAGREVPAGTYGFFAIPGKERWTLILNKRARQWGAFAYKVEEDVLRFEVKPETGPATEWMTFSFSPAGSDRMTVDFAWDKVRFSFPIEVDVDRIVWARYDAALADPKADWDAYLTAANYALNRGQRLEDAMTWIDTSISKQESFWNYETKAKLLHRQGKTKEALPLLEKALALSRGKTPQGYQDTLEKLKREWEAGLQ